MPPSSTHRQRLAIFTPLPPQATGVADYMRDLLPSLVERADIDLYIDDYEHDPAAIPAGCGVYPHGAFLTRRAEHPYDCAVYHLGNSPFHRYLYPYAVHFPGVAVLHDHVLHHLIAGMSEDGGSGFYFREMAYNSGDAGIAAAWEALMTHTEVPFYRYPLNRRLLDVSLGIAVHSDYLRDIVEHQAPAGPVGRIPMGMPLPLSPGPRSALREALGLPADGFIVGSFGQATLQKRLPQVLQAIANLVRGGLDAHYVIVGNVGNELDLPSEVRRLELDDRVTVTGYVDDPTFSAYLHAVDVCVNLRYPTAGETSAAALRCMAAGQPTIVTGVGANLEFGDEACLKLPVGDREVELLEHTLRTLQDTPDARTLLGTGARAYVAQEHSLDVAADALLRFIDECSALSAHPLRQRRETIPPSLLLKEVADRLNSVGITAQETPFMPELAAALAFVDTGPPGSPPPNGGRP